MSVDSWFPSVRAPSLKLGALFAGIGALDAGVEAAFNGSLTTVWQVEKNEFAQQVLAKHWPEAKRYGDIRKVNTSDLEFVDIITCGSPCPDISKSGKRAGLAGARSGLWFEARRIVRDLRPRVVIWENVPGSYSPIKRDGRVVEQAPIATILGDLAALGYDAWWDSVSAQDVGAPQVRERAFVVAYRPSQRLEESLASSQGDQLTTAARDRGRTTREGSAQSSVVRSAARTAAGLDSHRFPAFRGAPQVAGEPPRSAYGVANRQARIEAIGNTVVPQASLVVGYVARALLENM